MPNLVAISQATAKINRGAESAPQALSVSNRPGQIGLNKYGAYKESSLQITLGTNKGRFCNTIASVALVHT